MKFIISFFFILFFENFSFAQAYKPLLDYYNEWNVRFCYASVCDTDIYYTNGDTIVDGMNFKVLDGYHYISRGFLLREDVTERKVYLKAILPNSINDYLLYDFSLEVGDSIDMKNPITPFPENAGYYKVDSIIPRPLVDGNNYKHFYLSPTPSNTVGENNAIWVEGAGSLSIITAPGGDADIDGVGRLACMFKNGESFYSDLGIIDECNPSIILSVSSFSSENNNIKAISKPGTDIFELIHIDEISTIILYDIKGLVLDTFKINHQSSTSINLENYPSGMYLLAFESNHKRIENIKILVK